MSEKERKELGDEELQEVAGGRASNNSRAGSSHSSRSRKNLGAQAHVASAHAVAARKDAFAKKLESLARNDEFGN